MEEKSNRRTYLKVFVNLGIMLGLLLICIFVVPRVIVYFMPFVIGWMISLIASPMVRFLEKKLKIKRKASSAFVIIAVIALVIFVGYLVGAKVAEEVGDLVAEAPDLWAGVQADFAGVGNKLSVAYQYLPKEIRDTLNHLADNVQSYLGDAVGTLSSPTFEALSRFAKNLPNILISIIMCLLSSYFFIADREYIPNLIAKVMPRALLERWHMIRRGFKRAVGGYFKAQLKIEFWMYILLAVGFSILQVKYALVIAIGVAFLDLLPFFGTGTVLLPWAFLEFLNGSYTMVIGLLLMWGVGQFARQLIQPKIVGDSMGLSPIPTLILLFTGYKVAGVIGMIIAVPIGIIVLYMYEEGVFDTTINSIRILYAGISNFRHLKDEDMEEVRIYQVEEEKRLKEKEAAFGMEER